MSENLTDFEHQALMALVIHYGAEHIIEIVQDIGFALAEDEYNNMLAEED